MALIVVLLLIISIGLMLYTFYPGKKEEAEVRTQPVIDSEREKLEHPLEKWVYDSLKMRGYTVGARVPFGPFTADLTLPSYQIAVQCLREGDPITQKVYEKQLEHYLHKNGWRLIRLGPRYIYRDFQKEMRKLDMLKTPR